MHLYLPRYLCAVAFFAATVTTAPVAGAQVLRGSHGVETDESTRLRQLGQEGNGRRAQEVLALPTMTPSKAPSNLAPTFVPTTTSGPTYKPTLSQPVHASVTRRPTVLPTETPVEVVETIAPTKAEVVQEPASNVTGSPVPTTTQSNTDINANLTDVATPLSDLYKPSINITSSVTPEAAEMTPEAEEEDEDQYTPPLTTPIPAAIDESLYNSEQAATTIANSSSTASSDADSTKTARYDGISWADLPMTAKVGAMTLGHTEQTWDAGTKVETDYLDWDTLTPEDQMSATLLDFDKTSWNAKLSTHTDGGNGTSVSGHHSSWTDNPPPANTTTVETKIENTTNTVSGESAGVADTAEVGSLTAQVFIDYTKKTWDELPDDQKQAAQILGYDSTTWDQDAIVPARYLTWNQLSFDLREAAKALGFRQLSWNEKTISEIKKDNDGATTLLGTSSSTTSTHTSSGESTESPTSGSATERNPEASSTASSADSSASTLSVTSVVADMEPKMEAMRSEIDELKIELKTALDMIEGHEQILRLLSGLDSSIAVEAVQETIKVNKQVQTSNNGDKNSDGENQKRNVRNRRYQRNQNRAQEGSEAATNVNKSQSSSGTRTATSQVFTSQTRRGFGS